MPIPSASRRRSWPRAGRGRPGPGHARRAGRGPVCAPFAAAVRPVRQRQDPAGAQARTAAAGTDRGAVCADRRTPGDPPVRSGAAPGAAGRAPAGRTAQLRCALGRLPASAGARRRRAGTRDARPALRRRGRRLSRAAAPAGQQRHAGDRRRRPPAHPGRRTAEPLHRPLDAGATSCRCRAARPNRCPSMPPWCSPPTWRRTAVFDDAALRRIGYKAEIGPGRPAPTAPCCAASAGCAASTTTTPRRPPDRAAARAIRARAAGLLSRRAARPHRRFCRFCRERAAPDGGRGRAGLAQHVHRLRRRRLK
jgi:hypothetical protein